MTTRASLFRLIVLALLWGSSFLWIKLGLGALSPVQLVLLRVALGAAVLLILCRVRRLRLPVGGVVWLHLTIASLFANALPFVLFGIGEQTVDSGTAGALNATAPLWTLLVALLAGSERRLGIAAISGLLLGFGGTLLIFAPWHTTKGSTIWGAAAILGATLSYGIGAVYMSRNLAGRGIPPVALTATQLLLATGLTAVATPVAGLQPVHVDPVGLLAVVVLGVFGTGVAFVLYNRLIADEGATTASTVAYLAPVVAVLLGALALGEHVTPRVVAGIAIVVAGLVLTRRAPRRAAATPRTIAAPVKTG